MKRKEFIRIVTSAMEHVEKETGYGFTCNLISFYHSGNLQDYDSSIRKDYIKVFKECKIDDEIKVKFGLDPDVAPYIVKQVRLNALAMYLAQSLAFKTYEEL